MSHLITFALGYLLGGVTSLIVLGLTVAARRDAGEHPAPSPATAAEESLPVWREHL